MDRVSRYGISVHAYAASERMMGHHHQSIYLLLTLPLINLSPPSLLLLPLPLFHQSILIIFPFCRQSFVIYKFYSRILLARLVFTATILKQFFPRLFCIVLRPVRTHTQTFIHSCHGDFVLFVRGGGRVGRNINDGNRCFVIKMTFFDPFDLRVWEKTVWQVWYFSTFIIRSKRRAIRNH